MASKPFKAQVQENPIVSAATGLILIMATVTGSLSALGTFDGLIMTQAEHETDIDPIKQDVAYNKAWNKCVRFEARISDLKDRKWKRQQVGASPEAIRDIDKDIQQEQRNYNALNCDSILSE